MPKYRATLKPIARTLRSNLTDSEQVLWSRLRRKQILGVQFYRQRPLGDYIVDFYAPKVDLVIEVDGSQHMELPNKEADARRDRYLRSLRVEVIRFDNLQVLQQLDSVLEVIYGMVEGRLRERGRL